ncbi:DUF748 domain-containing protein [Thalassotalea euphylliae]|uniref:DUF748 domain-containing protein n=1 Tax=Thalassotalea euphylliae TaxID=1655234 RepID=A0A3E0UJ47_9GAMM|nr:DUF748 domain-containing protein [Thalassotalea euphylliae]REL36920.1 DUF748 domain-containing protein [Thalassotalea euphylliae]
MKIVNKWSTLGITFIVLLLLLMYASAPLVTYFANKPLAEQNLALEIKQLRFNPFTFSIDVEQLSLNHQPTNGEETAANAQQLLSLQQLALNLDAWRLFSGEIHIESVDLNGIGVQSELIEQELSFAGWQPIATGESDEPVSTPSDDNNQPWLMRGDRLILEDFTFTLQAKRQHNWHINKLVLSEVAVKPNANNHGQEIALKLLLESQLNQQPVNLDLALTHSADKTQLTLNKLQLAAQLDDFSEWLPQELQLSGQVELTAEAKLNKSNKFSEQLQTNWQFFDLKSQVATSDLHITVPVSEPVALQNSTLKLGNIDLAISADALNVVQREDDGTDSKVFDINNLTGEVLAQLAIQELDWQLTNGDTLATIASITASDAKAVLPEQSFQLASLSLTDGIISQAQKLHSIDLTDQQPNALANFEMLDITAIALTSEEVNIADIAINLTQTSVYKSNVLAAENWVLAEPNKSSKPSKQNTAEQTKESQETQASSGQADVDQSSTVAEPTSDDEQTSNSEQASNQDKSPAIRIGHIAVTGEGAIIMFDYTPSEPVIQRLTLNELWLKKIDSSQPQSASSFLLNSQLGKRSSIEIVGDIFPFTEHGDLNVKGKMSAVNLAPYSPYVVDAIDHKITQGQLTADFAFNLKDQQIDGEVTTLLKAMELAQAPNTQGSNEEKSKASGSLIPINAAISQLTDSQGNIELTFPLTGDINQPNLGIGGLISLITEKALKQGAKNYMIQTFLPYANIITVAMLASDSLFEISMEDLPYQAGQSELLAPQLDYAKQLAAVLTQQKDAQVVICPKVIKRDIAVDDEATLSGEQKKQLLALGESRLDLFTDHLIATLGVNAERIIHCQTVVEPNNNVQSRLSFAIK